VVSLKPKAVVFDIASIKAPLAQTLRAAAAEGLQVCSVHPMFGPDVTSVVDRNMIICDCGSLPANNMARALFDGASLVDMKLDDHDPLMAYVLGLSHAANIAFLEALRRSGRPYGDLARVVSTTFRRQATSAQGVVDDNPSLYFEIQRLNPYNREALQHLQEAVEDMKGAAERGDREAFEQLMAEGREYIRGD